MQETAHSKLNGILLVGGSALLWSFGGTIARFISAEDSWAIVFWRSLFAALFLLAYMLWRDGARGTLALFRNMGLPGLAVACCFGVASTSFVVALSYTTVANILLMQAGVPLIAALMAYMLFNEVVSRATWLAILAVIFGVAIMVSESFTGQISPVGDGLSLLIAVAFASATVITRRSAGVRMIPAVCLAVVLACAVAGMLAGSHAVSAVDMAWLFAFGAINLGVGLACFSIGARLIPSALAALVGTLEPVLGPLWVWLVHGEIPSQRTLIGGGVVFAALLVHLLLEWSKSAKPSKPGIAPGSM
jgi:drug/metabolite transporter (DMT)-like permease